MAAALEQRHEHLVLANDIRLDRAQLRRQLKAPGGAIAAARVILEEPHRVASMDIGDLLLQTRRIGKSKARNMLERRGISPWREVGKLTMRQRSLLAGDLVTHANRCTA